jgi:hypothetical protein
LTATRLILSKSRSRLVVINLVDLGGPLAAAEPIEHFEERRAFTSPSATAWPTICIAGASLANCNFAWIRLVVDDAPLERLAHDLKGALGRKLFLTGDFVIGASLRGAGRKCALGARPAHARQAASFSG